MSRHACGSRPAYRIDDRPSSSAGGGALPTPAFAGIRPTAGAEPDGISGGSPTVHTARAAVMPSVSRVGGAVAVRTAPRTPPSTRNEAVRRAGAVRPAAKAPPAAKIHPAAKVLAAGLAVGFLTGFFGVGGGFVVVPALVMVLGYPMPAAVGTSLLVIAVNSAAALTARVGHASLHWSLLIPFGAAALIGSLAGRPIADRVPAAALSKAFTVLLFAVAGYVAIRAGLGLSG